MGSNADNLRRLYRRWAETRGASVDDWLDIVSDDFRVTSGADEYSAAKFGVAPRGREGIRRYLENLREHWAQEIFEVIDVIDAGDDVVVVSNVAYRYRATDKIAVSTMVDVWKFRDGKAVSWLEVFDTASMVAATTPDAAQPGLMLAAE